MSALDIAMLACAGFFVILLLLDCLSRLFRRWGIFPKMQGTAGVHLENAEYGSVADAVDCLKISNAKGELLEVPWSEIDEVHAYKADLFSIDMICLVFTLSGKQER